MHRPILASLIAITGGLFVACAFADNASRSVTPSAYEYGNYDYYNTSQQTGPATASRSRCCGNCNRIRQRQLFQLRPLMRIKRQCRDLRLKQLRLRRVQRLRFGGRLRL